MRGRGSQWSTALRPARVLLVRNPLVPALGSTGSATDRSALFASFVATTARSDFPRSFIIGYRFSLPDATSRSGLISTST